MRQTSWTLDPNEPRMSIKCASTTVTNDTDTNTDTERTPNIPRVYHEFYNAGLVALVLH